MSATFELEGFEPMSRLGGGGFGDVWLARQTNVDRQVAIKVGHSAIQDETIRLRFDRECKALGRLSGHPNIVDVYTAGSLKDGRPYLVLEYIDGGTLWQRLKKARIPEADLRAIGAQMAAALAEAHSSGVLHRDLKPENILIRSSGEAVLGDFGIARLHDGANTTSAAITASVAYAAPEILSGKRATVASDLYGIGVCLLAAVFRSVPFVQKTDESIHPIINRVLTDSPPDVRRHGISDELAVLIDSLLSKDPGRRPASADELLERFKALDLVAPVPPAPDEAEADAGATRVVAPSGSGPPVAPTAPRAPSRPADRPAAPPRPEDAAPGLHNPDASAAWLAAQNSPAPITGGGYDSPFAPPADLEDGQRVKKEPSSNLKMFVLAYVATLIIGGIGVFVLSRLIADDGGDQQETEAGATAPEELLAAPEELEAGIEDATAAGGSGSQSEALTIPLAVVDTSFGATAETSDDSPGPGAGTLCDNSPDTQGLIEWKGSVISSDAGRRAFYQIVSRFETADQASDYLDAYAGTNDCESWLVTPEEGQGAEVRYTALQTPPPSYGDQSRQFDVTGQADGVDAIHAKILLIQSGTDVLGLSLTSDSDDDVAELAALATIAVERLEYDSP